MSAKQIILAATALHLVAATGCGEDAASAESPACSLGHGAERRSRLVGATESCRCAGNPNAGTQTCTTDDLHGASWTSCDCPEPVTELTADEVRAHMAAVADGTVTDAQFARMEQATGVTFGEPREVALRSCEAGQAHSCQRAALYYMGGIGTRRDDARAIELSRAGCRLGDGLSCGQVAAHYFRGAGVAEDRAEGWAFIGLACDAGDEESCEWLVEACGDNEGEACEHVRQAGLEPQPSTPVRDGVNANREDCYRRCRWRARDDMLPSTRNHCAEYSPNAHIPPEPYESLGCADADRECARACGCGYNIMQSSECGLLGGG